MDMRMGRLTIGPVDHSSQYVYRRLDCDAALWQANAFKVRFIIPDEAILNFNSHQKFPLGEVFEKMAIPWSGRLDARSPWFI